MTIDTVKHDIMHNQIKPFYIFTGEEVGVMDIYINKIANCIGTKPQRVNSIKDINSKLRNNSFIKSRNCYVVRDDKDFILDVNKNIWQDFICGKVQKNNVIILILTDIDKRKTFYKQNAQIMVYFELLSEDVLITLMTNKTALKPEYARILIGLCEKNYSRILLEIDKIKQYAESVGTTEDKAFEILLDNNCIYREPKDAIFDFVESVCGGYTNKSFELLQDSFGVGENPLTLISVLYTNFKQLLQVQSCQGNDIAKVTGLNGWQINNAKKCLNVYTTQELVKSVKLLHEVEKNIKLGIIDADIAVDYLLVNIL